MSRVKNLLLDNNSFRRGVYDGCVYRLIRVTQEFPADTAW